jgi:LacI family transcriptional regulator
MGESALPDRVSGRATVADVARLAGVSAKTVSRALSGSSNVNPRTLAKVQAAAATLRFRPNALARELRTGGSSSTVGFVIGEHTNPFYGLVATGAERVLAREGLTLVITATEDRPAREAPAVAAMLERRVRALLLMPIADDQGYLEGERSFGTPIVAVDRPLVNALSDSVVWDNRSGARDGVLALIDAGHRRIGFVGEAIYTHRERLAGYRDALSVGGIPEDPALVRTDGHDAASAEKATRELVDARPDLDAVFAGNNRAIVGVLQALRHRGEGIGLLAFDDFELAEALGLSVVAYDPQRMGEVAAELALARLSAPMGPVEQVVLPTRLILRGSERGGLSWPAAR